MDRTFPIQSAALHSPSLKEIAKVLKDGLLVHFGELTVEEVDCPDLTKAPFTLAAEGLCGDPRLADVGGVPYLFPRPQLDKTFNLEKVATLVDVPGGLVIGATAGPPAHVGVNSELIADVKAGSDGQATVNRTFICKVDQKDESYKLEKLDTTNFGILGNLYVSGGKPGKVIHVRASKRTGERNFMCCLRKTLEAHYGNKAVGLGGCFLIEKGKAWIHVMPDFCENPVTCNDQVEEWLKYYEMSSPLVCVGMVLSCDPGLDLRLEHFHCFSHHGDGGHYHWDTTPDDVVYHGYFNVAEHVFRLDRPENTHVFGRN